MNNNKSNFWDTPTTTPQGGSFWDTPGQNQQPTKQAAYSDTLASIAKQERQAKIQQAQQEADTFTQEAQKANSFGGLLSNFIKAVPDKFATYSAGRSILQSTARVGAPIGQLLSGDTSGQPFTPQGQFQQDLYGTNKPIDFTQGGNELGVKNKYAAPLVGGLITAGDIFPGGNEAKTAIKGGLEASEDTLKYIAKMRQSADLARTAGESTGILNKAKNVLQVLDTKFGDSTSIIKNTLQNALKENKISLLPSQDVGNQISRVQRAVSIGGEFLRNSDFARAVQEVPDTAAFNEYLKAKQAIDVSTQGIQTGRDLAMDSKLVSELAPQFEDAAQKIYSFNRSVLDKTAEFGLIDKDLAEALKVKYPNYVPLKRIFSEVEKAGMTGGNGTGLASNSTQSIIQGLKGSAREIEDPLTAIPEKVATLFAQGERNVAGKMLASYQSLPGNPFQLKEITGEVIGTRPTISFLDNGVKRTFETSPEIAQAAKSLNVEQVNAVLKAISLPTRVARLGLTALNPAFVGANLLRDQITAFINTEKTLSVMNPVNMMRAFYEAVNHGDLYDEAIRSGALSSTFDIARDQIPQSIDALRAARSNKEIAFQTITNPKQWLRTVENTFSRAEEATRLQVYRGTKMALLKQGLPEEEAIAGAAKEARRATVDFATKGEYGGPINAIWLYANANMQGVKTLASTLKARPLETMTKIGIAGVFPVMAVTAWNLSDPERKKVYEDIPQWEKDNNMIFIPPNATKDENGRWNVVKIPHSQEIRTFLQLPRRIMEQAYDLDPVKAGEVAQSLLGSFSPVGSTGREALSFLTPQAIKPTIQAATNKDLFTGSPIVSGKYDKLPTDQQVKADTSGLAQTVGNAIGASPIKVDKFAKDTFGSLADLATGKSVADKIGQRFTSAAGGAQENKTYEELANTLKEQSGKSFKLRQEAEQQYAELEVLSKEKGQQAAEQAFNKIADQNEELANKIIDIHEENQLGLTSAEKLMKQLGVKNGERAQFLWKKINELQSKEEKSQYVQNLIDKKIITNDVMDQIQYLKENGR